MIPKSGFRFSDKIMRQQKKKPESGPSKMDLTLVMIRMSPGNTPVENPPVTPGKPSEPPQESPPGNPRPEVPPPVRDPGEPAAPEELPGDLPDDLPMPNPDDVPGQQPPAVM